jgi:hypothetical protein
MVIGKNIIKKMKVEIETPSMPDALYFKDHIDTYFHDNIYPEIEYVLDELQIKSGNKIVRFDTIPIEINISSKDSINDIKPFIISKLKNIFELNNENNLNFKKTYIESKENDLNAFLFYLEKGRFPWWFTAKEKFDSTSLRRITNDPLFASKLGLILANSNVQKRLVFKLNDEALMNAVLALTYTSKNTPKSTRDLSLIKDIRLKFWQTILAQIVHENTSKYIRELEDIAKRISGNTSGANNHFNIGLKSLKKRVLPLINLSNTLSGVKLLIHHSKKDTLSLQLSKGKSVEQSNAQNLNTITAIESDELRFLQNPKMDVEEETHLEYQQSPLSYEDLEDGILIENAGLVLIHPFLAKLFNNLGFTSADKKIKEAHLSEALGVLHFLATKKELPYEQDLLCEKFICDIPFEQAISPVNKLSEKQKKACDELLDAVLTHWPALKSKNIDVLRNEFLSREGKISIEGEKQSLFIQRKTQDLLLDRIPWNLSLMKFPWKKNLVFLEW